MHWLESIRKQIEGAVQHYEKLAPTVAVYLDDLYVRINERPAEVRLPELLAVERLRQDGDWLQANYAANDIYHLQHRLGHDVTGHAGF